MLKPSLQLRLSQQLTMTPQLQQAIRLLQLPVMELQTQIQEALEQNVMLEAEEPESLEPLTGLESTEAFDDNGAADNGAGDDTPELDVRAETEWEDVQRTGSVRGAEEQRRLDEFEQADRSEETLKDHLLWQLELRTSIPGRRRSAKRSSTRSTTTAT